MSSFLLLIVSLILQETWCIIFVVELQNIPLIVAGYHRGGIMNRMAKYKNSCNHIGFQKEGRIRGFNELCFSGYSYSFSMFLVGFFLVFLFSILFSFSFLLHWLHLANQKGTRHIHNNLLPRISYTFKDVTNKQSQGSQNIVYQWVSELLERRAPEGILFKIWRYPQHVYFRIGWIWEQRKARFWALLLPRSTIDIIFSYRYVKSDKSNRNRTTYAFVEFKELGCIERVLATAVHRINGVRISVENANKRRYFDSFENVILH